jgi:hypothetical protein
MKIKTGLEKMIDKNVFEKGLTKEEIEKRLYNNLHSGCLNEQKVKDAIIKSRIFKLLGEDTKELHVLDEAKLKNILFGDAK